MDGVAYRSIVLNRWVAKVPMSRLVTPSPTESHPRIGFQERTEYTGPNTGNCGEEEKGGGLACPYQVSHFTLTGNSCRAAI